MQRQKRNAAALFVRAFVMRVGLPTRDPEKTKERNEKTHKKKKERACESPMKHVRNVQRQRHQVRKGEKKGEIQTGLSPTFVLCSTKKKQVWYTETNLDAHFTLPWISRPTAQPLGNPSLARKHFSDNKHESADGLLLFKPWSDTHTAMMAENNCERERWVVFMKAATCIGISTHHFVARRVAAHHVLGRW
jgi:hypothetical protein